MKAIICDVCGMKLEEKTKSGATRKWGVVYLTVEFPVKEGGDSTDSIDAEVEVCMSPAGVGECVNQATSILLSKIKKEIEEGIVEQAAWDAEGDAGNDEEEKDA